jgi:Polyketide cyclase / dehydrase and lipid transport
MRRTSLRGGIVAKEKVLAWDEGRRFAYRVDDVNAPGVRAFMEEWTVEPTAEGKTRLRWVLAVDGTKPVQLLLQLGRAGLDRVFSQAARRMAAS